MKKYNYLLFTLLLVLNGFSQTFRTGFERSDFAANTGQGYGFYCNATSTDNSGICHEPGMDGLADGLHGYLMMYRATHDKKYLDKFIIEAKRSQERRDDNINNMPLASIANPSTCSNISNLPQYNSPSQGWSYDETSSGQCCTGWYPQVLYSGKIIFPMADFVYLMKVEFPSDNDLQNTEVPTEALGTSQYQGTNPVYDISENMNVQTYSDFANWLEVRVKETIHFHDDFWSFFDTEYHQQPCAPCNFYSLPNPSSTIAVNQQCAMGKSLALMYAVSIAENNPNPDYQNKVIRIAEAWRQNASLYYNSLPSNVLQSNIGYYTWNHDFSHSDIEDAGHAIEELQFADICYRNGFTHYENEGGGLLFNLTDMQMFGNTVAYSLYDAPLLLNGNVAGTNSNCNGCSGPSRSADIANYGFMIPYNPYINEIISDFNVDAAIYGTTAPVRMAYLSYYQSPFCPNNHIFNPLAVFRREGPLYLNIYANTGKASASGDFDGDGNKEFAGAYDFAGFTFIQEYNLSTNNQIVIQTNNTISINGDVSSMASGDFDFAHIGEELAVCDPTNHKIYIYSITANSNNLLTTINSNAVSIASGDFDNDGDEDIIGCDNNNLYFYVNTGSGLTLFSTTVSSTQVNNVTAGNMDISHPGDEFLTISTNGGEMQMYSLQGSTITPTYNYPAQGNLNFTSICAGDFDGDGISEITAFCATNGSFQIYKLKNGQIVHNSQDEEYFPTNQLNGVMCSSRFSAFPQSDALVTLRNYDGQVTIFNMQGLCPNLDLTNSDINDAYSIDNPYSNTDNNYVVDYHVNNTLTAGNNFIIDAPSAVTFTAGNEIILKDGFTAYAGSDFHAFIDQGIACNNPVFRTQNPNHNISSPHAAKENIFQKQNGTLTVQPNPNSGKFDFKFDPGTNSADMYHITVNDMFGNLIFNKDSRTPQGNIDLSGNSNGIYILKVFTDDGHLWIQKIIIEQ